MKNKAKVKSGIADKSVRPETRQEKRKKESEK